MKLKSYFCPNVEGALRLAREELGPEAMLVDSRKAPPEARHLGECEVVFALETAEDDSVATGPGRVSSEPQADVSRFSAEMAEMRRQLERMTALMARSSLLTAPRTLPSTELAEVFAALVASEVEPDLAHDLVSRLRALGASASTAALRSMLEDEMGQRFTVDSRLGAGGKDAQIVALVGPPGSGKTTTLVKLATVYGVAARRPSQIITMDSYRIAAAEQLREYAAILGIGFQALETTGALAQAIEEHRRKGLIFIDTAGLPANDPAEGEDLARFFESRPDIDVHLVLSASMKSADLTRVVDRYESFRPSKLAFTRIDETRAFGPLLNEAARTGKAVSFLSGGQQIPEDLEPATKERITGLLLAPCLGRELTAPAA